LKASGVEGRKTAFTWLENGKEIHKGELQLGRHYDAVAFVSPAGNGFLVYCPNQGSRLFALYAPQGELIASYGWDLLAAKEQKVAEIGCCGTMLAMDPPTLSDDGWFLRATAPVTRRDIRIFLPAGRVMDDELTAQLGALLDPPALDVEALVKQLDDPSIEAREKASSALRVKGIHAAARLEKALASATGESKARLKSAFSRRSLRSDRSCRWRRIRPCARPSASE